MNAPGKDEVAERLRRIADGYVPGDWQQNRAALLRMVTVLTRHYGRLRMFSDLSEALMEVDRGRPHDLFEPCRTKGRRPRSLAEMERQGLAALALEVLICAGELKLQAARKVAKALEKGGYAFPAKVDHPGRMVAEWRAGITRASRGQGHHSEDWRWLATFYVNRIQSMRRAIKSGEANVQDQAKVCLAALGGDRAASKACLGASIRTIWKNRLTASRSLMPV
jgi:hypothetical protein